jgi:hypothetical protein
VDGARKFEPPGNRWSVSAASVFDLVWRKSSQLVVHSLHHSFRRTFCRLVRVVSRPNTGVRQTILDVICGRSRFFAGGRGFWIPRGDFGRCTHGTNAVLLKFVSLAAWMDGVRPRSRVRYSRCLRSLGATPAGVSVTPISGRGLPWFG